MMRFMWGDGSEDQYVIPVDREGPCLNEGAVLPNASSRKIACSVHEAARDEAGGIGIRKGVRGTGLMWCAR